MVFFTSVQSMEDSFSRNTCYCWGFKTYTILCSCYFFSFLLCTISNAYQSEETRNTNPIASFDNYQFMVHLILSISLPILPPQIILKQTQTSYYFTHIYFSMQPQKIKILLKKHRHNKINLNKLAVVL